MANQDAASSLNDANRWLRPPKQRAEPTIASSIPDLVPRHSVGDGLGMELAIPDDGDFEVAPKPVRLDEMEIGLYRDLLDICNTHNITPTALIEAFLLYADDGQLKEVIEIGKDRRAIRVRRGLIRRMRSQTAKLQAQMRDTR